MHLIVNSIQILDFVGNLAHDVLSIVLTIMNM
jgi:hypothetical protein